MKGSDSGQGGGNCSLSFLVSHYVAQASLKFRLSLSLWSVGITGSSSYAQLDFLHCVFLLFAP